MGKMSYKKMFLDLTGNGLPKGELKEAMFAFHNARYGKSKYVRKEEKPSTMCGSCIQRVKATCWKIYHDKEEFKTTYKEIEFTGRLGIHNMPIYKLTQEELNKRAIR